MDELAVLRVVGLFLVVATLSLAARRYVAARKNRVLLADRGIATSGTVTATETPHWWHVSIVSFQDDRGRWHAAALHVNREDGDTVRVIYDPVDPQRAVADEETRPSERIYAFMRGVFDIVMLLVGAWLLVATWCCWES